ncbi:hypothetical protein FACS1894102_3370 [Spirochaetia bacterium]|nr:hypothetical protein FACS1894102_3370 [Spirochaetia bacterium]
MKTHLHIFGLGSSSGVDTVRNLRSIIQGYLQNAYSYNAADATLLAEYITIYNAVYRKNRSYLTTRYKTPLFDDLTTGMEGLSVNYREWPGQTLMLIPLQTAADGSLSAIDTTVITDPSVIGEMRKDDDRGIDSRQQMVDLKERESEQAASRAEQQRAQAAAEEKRIAAEKSDLEKEKARIDAEQQALSGDNSADAEKRKAELEELERQIAEQENQLDKDSEAVAEKNAAADANEALAARKAEEADADRAAISGEQRDMIAAGSPPQTSPATASGVLGIRLSSANATTGSPVQVNPVSADVMKTSTLNAVQARTLTLVGGKILAIAGEKGAGSPQHLIEIDSAELRMLSRGDDEISPNSLIWVNGNNIFAILVSGGKNYIARFGADLKLQAKSTEAVHGMASVNFQGSQLITQNEKGAVILLKADTLER